jgi:hypothetical protein
LKLLYFFCSLLWAGVGASKPAHRFVCLEANLRV